MWSKLALPAAVITLALVLVVEIHLIAAAPPTALTSTIVVLSVKVIKEDTVLFSELSVLRDTKGEANSCILTPSWSVGNGLYTCNPILFN
jgi:hypothetical protein